MILQQNERSSDQRIRLLISAVILKKIQGSTAAEFAEYFRSCRVFAEYLAFGQRNLPTI